MVQAWRGDRWGSGTRGQGRRGRSVLALGLSLPLTRSGVRSGTRVTESSCERDASLAAPALSCLVGSYPQGRNDEGTDVSGGSVALSHDQGRSPQGFLEDPLTVVRKRAQIRQTLPAAVATARGPDSRQGFSGDFAALETLDRSMQQCPADYSARPLAVWTRPLLPEQTGSRPISASAVTPAGPASCLVVQAANSACARTAPASSVFVCSDHLSSPEASAIDGE